MLSNAISMLVFIVRPYLKGKDAPMALTHYASDGAWQIIVSRVPHTEVKAA